MELFKKLNQEYDEFVSLKKPSFHLMENGSLRCVSEYDQKEFPKTYVEMRTGIYIAHPKTIASDARYYSVVVYENGQLVDDLYTYDEEQAIKFAYLYAHQQWTGESYDTA